MKRSDASLDFLAQLSDNEKKQLYRLGKNRFFAKNAYIFKAGENDLNVYVVKHGRVKLFGSSTEGRDVLLWFSIAGEIFGMAECLQEKPRQIYARAAETCEILCITHSQFKEWLRIHPEIAFRMMKIMAARMREIGQRFLSLANGNILMEIAQLLIRLASGYGHLAGQHIHLGIPLTEQDIADMVGSSRQGVSTCLAKMKREGTLDSVKHFLVIKKMENLHQIAQGSDTPVKVERRSNRRAWQNVRTGS